MTASDSELRSVGTRARRSLRKRETAPAVPLGIRILAVVGMLQGLPLLLDPRLATGDIALLLIDVGLRLLAVVFLWWGLCLFRGSRIALDILIGAWFAEFGFLGCVSAHSGQMLSQDMAGIAAIYGAIIGYLFWCRPRLFALERYRLRR